MHQHSGSTQHVHDCAKHWVALAHLSQALDSTASAFSIVFLCNNQLLAAGAEVGTCCSCLNVRVGCTKHQATCQHHPFCALQSMTSSISLQLDVWVSDIPAYPFLPAAGQDATASAFSPDGSAAALATAGSLMLCSWPGLQPLLQLPQTMRCGAIRHLRWLEDGRHVLGHSLAEPSRQQEGTVAVWDVLTASLSWAFTAPLAALAVDGASPRSAIALVGPAGLTGEASMAAGAPCWGRCSACSAPVCCCRLHGLSCHVGGHSSIHLVARTRMMHIDTGHEARCSAP